MADAVIVTLHTRSTSQSPVFLARPSFTAPDPGPMAFDVAKIIGELLLALFAAVGRASLQGQDNTEQRGAPPGCIRLCVWLGGGGELQMS